MDSINASVCIWDLASAVPEQNNTTILWRDFSDDANIFSIPQMIAADTPALRQQLTAWIHDVSQTEIKGKTITDHFTIRKGFSYWWMTEFAEMQHFGKSPQLYDVIRLLVFEKWFAARNETRIVLITDRNKILAGVLEKWCQQKGIAFELDLRAAEGKITDTVLRRFRYIPHIVQAAVHLGKYILERWGTGPDKQTGTNPRATVTFLDYMVDPPPTETFSSSYWTKLVDVIDARKIENNWFHFWVQPSGKKHLSFRSAIGICKQLNTSRRQRVHSIFNAQVSLRQFFHILRDYLAVNYAYLPVKQAKHILLFKRSGFDFAPFFKYALTSSVSGVGSIYNLLYLNRFEEVCAKLPKQKAGFYLQENLGWENAFLYAWKSAGHGTITGVPHVTIRPWDLRYFVDQRSYHLAVNARPKPDRVALNSHTATEIYLAQGYPAKELVETEALRYLYLGTIAPRDTPATQPKDLRVLVLGDYLLANTDKQLRWLTLAAEQLSFKAVYTIKPHPVCPVNKENYPSLDLAISYDAFVTLFAGNDIVFTSNVTSSAVDAYSASMPVISMIDGDIFNMSPLSDVDGVTFVTNPQQLAAALENGHNSSSFVPAPYFFLESGLPRWKALLDSAMS